MISAYPSRKTVLIIGISSGLGFALAKKFAKEKYNIIAVAHPKDGLEKIKKELTKNYNIDVETISINLSEDMAAKKLFEVLQYRGHVIDILVNDIGIGHRDYFVEGPCEKYDEMIRVNILTLVHLTHLFAKDMLVRNEGKILQVGAVTGLQTTPLMAVYQATKAFVVSLSKALATEFEELDSNVTITCCCLGDSVDDFFKNEDVKDTKGNSKNKTMHIEEVADGCYKALMNGERLYISGAPNKVMSFIRRVW